MTSTVVTERAEWLTDRRSGIGASDVAGITGTSPWASPWSVWADKCGLVPLDDEDPAEHLLFGRDLEPVIARWFHDRTGLHVAGEQTMVRHRRFEHHFATVDGFVLDGPEGSIDDALGCFEAKTDARAWDELPAHYADQVMWQLHVTGLPAAWVAAMQFPFGHPRFHVIEVARDDKRIAELVAAVEEFWHDHVLTGVPPLADGSEATTKAIQRAWGHVSTSRLPIVDFDAHRPLVTDYAELKRQEKAIGDRIRFHANAIRAEFGYLDEHLSDGYIDGELAVSWRARQPGDAGVDVEAVRRDHGDAYDKPRGEPTRALLLHGRYKQ